MMLIIYVDNIWMWEEKGFSELRLDFSRRHHLDGVLDARCFRSCDLQHEDIHEVVHITVLFNNTTYTRHLWTIIRLIHK